MPPWASAPHGAPYLVGENGGGAYVLLFCLAMILIGIPMILVENVIGRRRASNSLDAFGGSYNGKPVHKAWKAVGWLGLGRRFRHHGLLYGAGRLGAHLYRRTLSAAA